MQIKTFYLNDNITLVDASALAQVSIINIMQISAPLPPLPLPPLPLPSLLSVPATSRHYTTLNSESVYASMCIYACTQVYLPRPPFLTVLIAIPLITLALEKAPLLPLIIFTRRSFIKSGRPHVHILNFIDVSINLPSRFPFTSRLIRGPNSGAKLAFFRQTFSA